MKTLTFKYDPHPRKTALEAMAKAQKIDRGEIQKDEISCRSMEEMMKVMTKTRFQIFTAVLETSPNSLTELAEVLGKDLGNVMKDIKVLESLGLIELERSKGKHGEKVKPVALYDRIIFECEPKRYRRAS
jgi:predicted transcriptional regulator